MTSNAELIAEVRDLFAEGWCICRSSTLGERVLNALVAAEAERDAAIAEAKRTFGTMPLSAAAIAALKGEATS